MWYGYLFGMKGSRKVRSPWYRSEAERNLDAYGYAKLGLRVRKYETIPEPVMLDLEIE